MNKLKYLFISLSFFLSSCNLSNSENDAINLIVNDFNMTQLSSSGDKIYDIISPKSNFNKNAQIYLLDKTKIIFYEEKKPKYIVNSNKAQLLNHEIIKLSGEIIMVDVSDENNIINADNFSWDTKKSYFILEGNVRINNNNVDLISSKAFLNKKSDVIEFSKPVKYNYKPNNNNSTYNISSNNAYYDLRNKNLIFKSESDKERVKSNITF